MMSDRFVALNVGMGDAFFLERSDFAVLVDGGLDTSFPSRFVRTTGRDGVDVLVCTHNDKDHANGIVEFLNDGLGAKECWLPATWLEALEDLLEKPDEVIFDVILKDSSENEPPPPLADADEGGADEPRRKPQARPGPEITVERIDRLLDREAEGDPRCDDLMTLGFGGTVVVISSGGKVLPYGFPHGGRGSASRQLLLDAANIRRIAIAAARKGVRIRWFDPEHAPSAPAPDGPLQVVNASEVRSIRRTTFSPRDVLRLTQINRDSLVLYSRASAHAPPVFFSADSGLDIGAPLPGGDGMVVTAPHHGSKDRENVAAYRKLAAVHGAPAVATWTWVRSDRRTAVGGMRPCGEYLSQAHRFCTNCRGTLVSQSVFLLGSGSGWVPAPGITPCACTDP